MYNTKHGQNVDRTWLKPNPKKGVAQIETRVKDKTRQWTKLGLSEQNPRLKQDKTKTKPGLKLGLKLD